MIFARDSEKASCPSAGAVVLVTSVGAASGARAAAAALACAGSEPDRAALLIDLGGGPRAPRPSLVASTAARELEERLAAHLPDAGVASRGQICQLTLAADPSGLDGVAAALPVARDSIAVVHLAPHLLRPLLDDPRIRASAALLRADLDGDRPLTALAARDLIDRGLRVAVLKRPLGWLSARAALLGALRAIGDALPIWLRERLLNTDDSKFHRCYDEEDEFEGDREETLRHERQGSAPARWGEEKRHSHEERVRG